MDNYLANKQNTNLTLLSQYSTSSFDGSLSDILQLPSQYHNTLESNLPHYNALLLENEEPFIKQPTTIHTSQHHQISHQHNQTFHINEDAFTPIGHHFDKDFYIDPSTIFKEPQLSPAIINFNYDAQHMVLPPPLPPLAPVPLHTRRPPLRKGTPSYREAHIQSERQRRQDMTQSFNRLRSLLPSMQDNDLQGDRCTILGHVIKYVQELDNKVQELGKVKAQLMQEEEKRKEEEEEEEQEEAEKAANDFTTNVSVRYWGNLDIFITLNCPKQRGLWPNLLALLQETLQLDVQNVALSSTPLFCVHSIYAKVVGKENQEVSCEMLQETLGNFVANHSHKNIMR